jgi:uncharacterized delta-60 repeat protein
VTNAFFVKESQGYAPLTLRTPGSECPQRTIQYFTTDGTALGRTDFEPSTNTLTVYDCIDCRYANIYIPIYDNPRMDGNRTFTVTLFNPGAGVVIGPTNMAVVTIIDDDNLAGPPVEINGSIQALTVQPDEKVVLAGIFNSVNGVYRAGLARLNSSASLDLSFDAKGGADDYIETLASQKDGKILAGGRFSHLNGIPLNKMARLNSDGSLDTTFNIGSGWSGVAEAGDASFPGPFVGRIVIQADGKLMVGANCTNYNGAYVPCLARLNGDGSLDSTFQPDFENHLEARCTVISQIHLVDDGKIYLTATFKKKDQSLPLTLFRLNDDGTFDASFTPVSLLNLSGFYPTLDGKVLISSYSSGDIIQRLNHDGSLDLNFAPVHTDWGFSSFLALPGNKILGINRDGALLWLDSDGSLDTTARYSGRKSGRITSAVLVGEDQIWYGGDILGRIWVDGSPVQDLKFRQPVIDSKDVHLAWTGSLNQPFRIQGSADLGHWSTLATNINPQAAFPFTDTNGLVGGHRFYRVQPIE